MPPAYRATATRSGLRLLSSDWPYRLAELEREDDGAIQELGVLYLLA